MLLMEEIAGVLIGIPVLVCLVANIGVVVAVVSHPVVIVGALAAVFLSMQNR